MKHATKIFLCLLTLCAPCAVYAETLTIEGDLQVQGGVKTKGAFSVYNANNSGVNYFRWSGGTPGELLDSNGSPLGNQVIYVEFADVQVWGAITVSVTGGWHDGKNTGLIRKTFAASHNPGWSHPNTHQYGANSGEQLELAIGPIANRYKIGSLTHENTGVLRVPIYKLADSKNEIVITVEGHILSYSVGFDPETDLSLSAWEVVAEDHVVERIALDVGSITFSDGTSISSTVGLGGAGTGSTLVDPLDSNNVAIVVSDGGDITAAADKTIELAGTTTVSGAMNVTGTITMAAQGDIPMFGQ